MLRSKSFPTIILSVKKSGENNSSVILLTPEKGITYATLYGGAKSKKKSLICQWNSGDILLYEIPEKNQIKITDFEVKNFHLSFSQSLYKMYAANLAAEIAIKTQCAGSPKQCFYLLSGFLDGMDICDEEQSKLGLLRFLWRYLELLGVQPQTHCCSSCGESFFESKFDNDSVSYYNNIENCFFCSDCGGPLPVKTTGIKYLYATSVLSPSEVRKLKIDKDSYNQIKQIVFSLIESNIGQKLNSIETGFNIF